MSIRNIVLCAALLSFSSYTLAQDWRWGLASSISNEPSIRLPISNGDFVIEPYFSRYNYNQSYRDEDFNKNTREEAGTSIWKVIYREDKLSLRVGLQAAYVKETSYYSYVNLNSAFATSGDFDGYLLAPGIGMFYDITHRLSIGVEASFKVSNLTGSANTDDVNGARTDRKQHSETTNTQVVIEFYF